MIATAVLAAQFAGTFDVLDTSRIQARASQPAPVFDTPRPEQVVIAADVATTAVARLRLTGRQWQFLFSYSPSLYLPDVELGIAPLATQTGSGSVNWHNRSWRISVSEAASYGQINSALVFPQLAAAAPPTGTGQPAMTGQPGQPGQPTMTGQPALTQPAGVQTAAAPTTINLGSLNTSAIITLLSVRRTVISVSGGHTLAGGLTEADEAVLPKQYGGHAEASVLYRASRRDGLVTSVAAQDTFTTGACAPLPGQTVAVAPAGTFPPFCHEESPSIQVQETVRHQLSPVTTMSFGVGVAAAVVETDDLAQELAILPVVIASLSERFDSRGTNLLLSAQMAPLVDPRTGYISQRAGATISVSKTITRTLRVVGSANVLQSVPFPVSDPNPITALGGGIEARITLDRQAILGVGEQTFWQNQEGYGMLVSTIGYVSLTVLAPTLRF